MKISLGPFTLIRTSDLTEHEENMRLLLQHIELLKEKIALKEILTTSTESLRRTQEQSVIDKLVSQTKWMN